MGFVQWQKTPCFEAKQSYERGEWSENEGRNERGCLQDTGAAVTNDTAKAKGMTAWSEAKPLGEQLVLLEGLDVWLQRHGL